MCRIMYTKCFRVMDFRVIYFPLGYIVLIVWVFKKYTTFTKKKKNKVIFVFAKKFWPPKAVKDFNCYSQWFHLPRTSLSFLQSFPRSGVLGKKISLCKQKWLMSMCMPPFPLGGAKSLFGPLYVYMIHKRIFFLMSRFITALWQQTI